jgi:hypothetical protein
MTLFLLPTAIEDLQDYEKPFSAALRRVVYLPPFRRVTNENRAPNEIVEGIARSPVVIFMVNTALPSWVLDLGSSRDIGVLTPSPDITKQLSGFARIHAGTLIEANDLREAYRVFRELLSAAGADASYESSIRSTCQHLAEEDLFASRPRLGFIPPLTLPFPGDGRPAVYLINRLSNNVDEPSLSPGPTADGWVWFPQLLRAYKMACTALALMESGQALPGEARITKSELEQHHAFLTSATADDKEKNKLLRTIGWQLSEGKWSEQSFLSIPVPRFDLVRGKTPKSLTKRPGHNLQAGTALHAVKDLMRGKTVTSFKNENQKKVYTDTQWTMQTEQRLLACQSAWLGARTNSIPTQFEPLPGELFNELYVLDQALKTDSRKVPGLFRSVELILSEVLPKGFAESLSEGASGVTLHSDLPFEWALVGEWPLCLTRPVSRIPIGLTDWDVLSAALERPCRIDIKKPENVLVFDLIESHDSIRRDSDAFISSSASLGQHYTYASPRTAAEFREVLIRTKASIVMLDAHGSYDRVEDKLYISLKGTPVLLDELLGDAILPSTWMLSACETSVVGSIRGCFVRRLLAHGAVCVIATLSRVDAFMASIFIGKLLTEIFNPTIASPHRTLEEVFFFTQASTALAYDPLLPLFRRATRDADVKLRLGYLLADFFKWVSGQMIDIRKFRTEVALFFNEGMEKYGLIELQRAALQGGLIRPETLLFTCFGVPKHIDIE